MWIDLIKFTDLIIDLTNEYQVYNVCGHRVLGVWTWKVGFTTAFSAVAVQKCTFNV